MNFDLTEEEISNLLDRFDDNIDFILNNLTESSIFKLLIKLNPKQLDKIISTKNNHGMHLPSYKDLVRLMCLFKNNDYTEVILKQFIDPPDALTSELNSCFRLYPNNYEEFIKILDTIIPSINIQELKELKPINHKVKEHIDNILKVNNL